MKSKKVYLKVKLKSLAAESKIIRLEEKRNKELRADLAHHRRSVVREEARLTYLAYGFIKGKTYEQIEKSQRTPDWERVKKMIEKYGVCEGGLAAKARQLEAFEAWKPKQQ